MPERMLKHVTDVMVTCRNGTVRAPTVLKAQGGKTAAQASKARKAGEEVVLQKPTAADVCNLRDQDAPDGMTLKIDVGVTHNGSMTLELFRKWVRHFNPIN